jgi:RimJ/RimL family protein N-acetyltransferase
MTGPTLSTARLILRPWHDDDLQPFAAMSADATVMEYFPALLGRAESAAMVERIRAHFVREGFGLWAIEVPGVAPFIGFAGLARPTFMPVVEVGWRLARAYWGAGYATEAGRAAVEWGFSSLPELDEIVAFVAVANTRSQRVMDRLGMTRDPDADFDHPHIPEGHHLRRHWLYRLPRPG